MRIFSTGFSNGFDGPGRRWVVYLKGCNLRCRWCANPESLIGAKQTLYYPARGAADEKVCSHGAIASSGEIDRSVCKTCSDFECVTRWNHMAFELAGEDVTSQWVLEKALQAKPLFGQLGGVTFGGGEPTMQADGLLETIGLLKNNGIHVAMESNAGTADFEKFIDQLDWLICDVKCVSGDLHKSWTGCDNAMILDNIAAAAKRRDQLMVRIPLVAGFNDSQCERDKIIKFVASLECEKLRVEILRMHHLGKCKYEALGLEYTMENLPVPTMEAAEQFANELSDAGLDAQLE